MDRKKIGFVVGLTAEARLLHGCGVMVAVGGGTAEGASLCAAQLIDGGAIALVSFGLAGGLNWALDPGHILIPELVEAGQSTYKCDPVLVNWLGGKSVNRHLGGTTVAATRAAKEWLFLKTKADAIDLESGEVGRVAFAHRVPFAVLRAVCDPAARDLPPAALIALDGGGRIGILRVLASVMQHPGQVPGLLRLAADAAAARAALKVRLRALMQ